MNEGSFDYLYVADILDEVEKRSEAIERMAETIAKLGYAPDAAQETFELLLEIRATEARMKAYQSRLESLWQAVEWWRSGDWGEERVREALAKYRGQEHNAEDSSL